MTAIPKPKKTNKSVPGPQLTEYDFMEIGEKIGESLEFGTEIELTTYSRKRHETHTGIVKNADSQNGMLSLRVSAFDTMRISINSIVSVK